ncbi:MAG: exodeoxyribonuclease VII large subunit [Dysgonamonadaceae bacterium]|nr:exodeoxyribonuclease VII large subunit [Dysgonamonadaceae bacterium]
MNYLSLSQLNELVRQAVKSAVSETYWIMAETSDVRINGANRHCYLEFVEKNPHTNAIIARSKGYIWANTFESLKSYFEQKTGREFGSGLKVLVQVSVEFHPVFGFGLNVWDIDPDYTLGDLQAQRRAILKRLEEEGVLSLNKELVLECLPQRIAVISSPTAAGYEDFLKHLSNNRQKIVFYPRLFPALMQGEQTGTSIIAALDKIFEYKNLFDVVVIIRGGGATSDLASFDSYDLAANCAQFPLPIVTGIGHERDDTVLDFVSFYRAKTPTAVADFLIDRMEETLNELMDCQENITDRAQSILSNASERLLAQASYLPLLTNRLIEKEKSALEISYFKIRNASMQKLTQQDALLKGKEAFLKLSSPEYILAKGYSITLKNGKVVKSAQELQTGDRIETVLSKGKISSTVRDSYFNSK